MTYTVDGEDVHYRWGDEEAGDLLLSRMNVFDRHCASVYVTEKTDVAFRPLGLDLFDKLADACGRVRTNLEKERELLKSQTLRPLPVPPDTVVQRLLVSLTSLTDPEHVKELASLSDDDRDRAAELTRILQDFRSDERDKKAQETELRTQRAKVLLEALGAIAQASSDSAIEDLGLAHHKARSAAQAVAELHASAFSDQPLPSTGSGAWRQMWDAAKRYSRGDAYPQEDFPFTARGSRCVLCQEKLTPDASSRLRGFREFLTSDAQAEYDRANAEYEEHLSNINADLSLPGSAALALSELAIDDSDLAEAIRETVVAANDRKELTLRALAEDEFTAPDLPKLPDLDDALRGHIETLESHSAALREANPRKRITALQRELDELEARQQLALHLDDILEEIRRKTEIAAYKNCISDTHTAAITRKSVQVTEQAVTDQLVTAFEEELLALAFRDVEVHLVPAGGSRGSLYHELRLRRAPGVDVGSVVSDGQSRCLSIAAFFAELVTADHTSAILFDDPVSSLDHTWRRHVARRLVKEAQTRQVVVFTHDVVFLVELTDTATKLNVDLQHQHLFNDGVNAGRLIEGLPWVAERVSRRIRHLRHLRQNAEKVYHSGELEQYRQKTEYIYGRLRESWERGIEEVLLNETVERYRKSIETRRTRCLADITSSDLDAIDAGMTKCSTWMSGHDSPPADNAPVPGPDEVAEDIEALAGWVGEIRARRN
ncbi:AAA family ATPase [Candidatus Palauibacter sp.]|uniref:AAA family ATPase n=1 Tax=Candidatus Palauibacter sp. TaxID=3101350 RepID=UPI003B02C4D6